MKRFGFPSVLILLLFSTNCFAETVYHGLIGAGGRSGNAQFQLIHAMGQSLSTGNNANPCAGLFPIVSTIATYVATDTDNDGIPDYLEDKNNNDQLDAGETDPDNPDTDGDGIADGLEDANHDGILDPGETDPTLADTDGDGIDDGWELQFGLNPIVDDAGADPDNDLITNLEEFQLGLNPTDGVSDSDDDTLMDRWELDHFGNLDNTQNDDSDGDGYTNIIEYKVSTDPMDNYNRPVPGIFYEYDELGRLKRIWRIPSR
jgi:hypothetical protein